MTKQTCESCVGHSARLSLEQDKGNLRELTAGDRFMIVRVNSWKTLAALMLAMSVASIGAPSAAQIQTQQDKQSVDQAQAATRQPTAVERESWRKMILHTPRPRRGCFVATYPETEWREVACKTPPHTPYQPKLRGGIRTDTVGGSGTDFSPQVTGHISEGEGSFDDVTGVTNQTSSTYSLQLNTDNFTTTTCSNYALCRGWEQFVYSNGSNSGYIQYWLIRYGPQGTLCPTPRHNACGGFVYSDGWCPFSVRLRVFQIFVPSECLPNTPVATDTNDFRLFARKKPSDFILY
jgi:hypothetical protein